MCCFSKKIGHPGLFLLIFGLIKQTSLQILHQIYVIKCPSSIGCWYSNPQPLGHESPSITTRPGLPPNTDNVGRWTNTVALLSLIHFENDFTGVEDFTFATPMTGDYLKHASVSVTRCWPKLLIHIDWKLVRNTLLNLRQSRSKLPHRHNNTFLLHNVSRRKSPNV